MSGVDPNKTFCFESTLRLSFNPKYYVSEVLADGISYGGEHFEDVNVRDWRSYTLLMCVAENGCLEAVQLLLKDERVDPTIQQVKRHEDGEGRCYDISDNALHIAVRHGHQAVVEELLKDGRIDINCVGTQGTALHVACLHYETPRRIHGRLDDTFQGAENDEIMGGLLDVDGIDINMLCECETSLSLPDLGHPSWRIRSFSSGGSVSEDVRLKVTPLHCAIEGGYSWLACRLLENPELDINRCDSGYTVLHQLSGSDMDFIDEVLEEIVKCPGFDVNAICPVLGQGCTPLSRAVEYGEGGINPMIKFLLDQPGISIHNLAHPDRNLVVQAVTRGGYWFVKPFLDYEKRRVERYRAALAEFVEVIGDRLNDDVKENLLPAFIGQSLVTQEVIYCAENNAGCMGFGRHPTPASPTAVVRLLENLKTFVTQYGNISALQFSQEKFEYHVELSKQ